RFGDPETQPLLALLDSSLFTLLRAAATGTLRNVEPPRFRAGAAVAVVMAADGYPVGPRQGDVIEGVDVAEAMEGVSVLHAGTAVDSDGRLVTAGGRVLAVTATGADVAEARDRAYAGVAAISIDGVQVRTDIAAKAAGG